MYRNIGNFLNWGNTAYVFFLLNSHQYRSMFILPQQSVWQIIFQSSISIWNYFFVSQFLAFQNVKVWCTFEDKLRVFVFESLKQKTKKVFGKITLKSLKFGSQGKNLCFKVHLRPNYATHLKSETKLVKQFYLNFNFCFLF